MRHEKQKITIPVPMEHRYGLNSSRRRELGKAVVAEANHILDRKPAHLIRSFHNFLDAWAPSDGGPGWLMLDGAGWMDRVRRIKSWAGTMHPCNDWDLDTHFHEWVLKLYLSGRISTSAMAPREIGVPSTPRRLVPEDAGAEPEPDLDLEVVVMSTRAFTPLHALIGAAFGALAGWVLGYFVAISRAGQTGGLADLVINMAPTAPDTIPFALLGAMVGVGVTFVWRFFAHDARRTHV